MKLGIVGLPNVGKSTLFNAITNAGAEVANYAFCTINPNVGMVSVPDVRLDYLAEMYQPKKKTPAVIEFVDIAGLVKGASKGEGLGNKFLSNIRATDAIVHVVRCFDDENVMHVEGSTDPLRDIDIINTELIMADLEMIDRRIDKANPRTADREIPAGKISARAALRFVIVNALLFIVTASTINLLTGLLSPVALFVILMYSYCKRFTALAHLVLGLGLGIAPVGAYIAVTGHFAWPPCILALLVMTWCGGFDIIYALQDADFDRKNGLYSIPARFSARVSLLFSILLHVVSVAALFWFGSYCPQNGWLWLGEGIFTLILVAEHLLVTPTRQRNIGIAFGTLNGIASTVLAVFVITALLRG